MSGRIGVISLGCSKNRINTEQMMYLLSSAGYDVSGEIENADVVLVNTCGFIESAKSEAIELIVELIDAKNQGVIGKLVVAGCLPERHKDEILLDLPEIDVVLGTGSFDDIVEAVCNAAGISGGTNTIKKEFYGDIDAPVSETSRIITTSPIWAYLKVAEGCDNRCSYCCIPAIRGKFRSRPMEKIIEEAGKLALSGIGELIIVAQDVTNYGRDIYGEKKLTALLKALNSLENLRWIRLHYLYPDEICDELIDVIAESDKILPYLDIPIQHINDEILKKMNRRGTGEEIRALFNRIRERIPGAVLRTSLITGLPGEGEAEFSQLCDFLEEAKIERVGVFAYCPEEGTEAALMERPSKETAEKRAETVSKLQSEIMNKFNESRIGDTVTVLVENDIIIPQEPEVQKSGSQEEAYYMARSAAESPEVDGYIRIRPSHDNPGAIHPNTFIDVRIIGIEDGELVGEPL